MKCKSVNATVQGLNSNSNSTDIHREFLKQLNGTTLGTGNERLVSKKSNRGLCNKLKEIHKDG